jgi:hypothetical protein
MFDTLRRKLDRWLTASKLGERYVKIQELLGKYVKEDEGVGTARAILELVCEAEAKWAEAEGSALRITVDSEYHLGLFGPEFDEWKTAATAVHEHFKKACHAACDAFHAQAMQSSTDPDAIADLNRAKEVIAGLIDEQSLQDYLRIRCDRRS